MKIAPHSQAHWQVALADSQPKSAKELAFLTHGQTEIKHETLKLCINHYQIVLNLKVLYYNLCICLILNRFEMDKRNDNL